MERGGFPPQPCGQEGYVKLAPALPRLCSRWELPWFMCLNKESSPTLIMWADTRLGLSTSASPSPVPAGLDAVGWS